MNKDFIAKVTKLVDAEIVWRNYKDYDTDCELPDCAIDSFGEVNVIGRSEPEDAIWFRDHETNFDAGFRLGVRNTLKVLKDNPELLEEL